MKYESQTTLNTVFGALSDPTRRAILTHLRKGESHVGEVAGLFDLSAPAISRHLKVLEDAGLIERKVDAQFRRLCLHPDGFMKASQWFEDMGEFWRASLDQLEQFLTDEKISED